MNFFTHYLNNKVMKYDTRTNKLGELGKSVVRNCHFNLKYIMRIKGKLI